MREERDMGAGRGAGTRKLTLLALLAALAALALPAAAQATKVHLFKETFGSAVQQKSFSSAGRLAVDTSNGDLLVLDIGTQSNGLSATILRFKPNGEPDPFPALGTNVIDGKVGSGKKPCAEEPSSCDETPEHGFKVGSEGATGFAETAQIAIDDSGTATDGNIYLTQAQTITGAHWIYAFAADGHYLSQLTRAGAGGEEFEEPTGLAVDGAGNLYVGDLRRHKIYKFDPVANPPSNADFTTAFASITDPWHLAAGAGPSAGSLFVTTRSGLYKIDSGGGALKYPILEGLVGGEHSTQVQDLSVDPTDGHLFVLRPHDESAITFIEEYDASGSSGAGLISSTDTTESGQMFRAGNGLAADGDIYVTAGSGKEVRVHAAAIATAPAAASGSASALTPTRATLNATVNADGVPLTECIFEYKSKSKPSPKTVPCEGPLPSDAADHAVQAKLTELSPDAEYSFRILATNSAGITVRGKYLSFLTPKIVEAKPATKITGASATLNALLYPDGAPVTECRFRYISEAAYQAARTAEVQRLTLSGATGGTFALSFEGRETAATGSADVVAAGSALGKGNLTAGSNLIKNVTTTSGAFAVGQRIVGEAFSGDVQITSVGAGTLTISKAAPFSKTGDTLTADSKLLTNLNTTAGTFARGEQISGAGIPAGTKIQAIYPETHSLEISANPSASGSAVPLSAALPFGATPIDLRITLAAIGVGAQASGSPGGPYTITFDAPADVPQLGVNGSALTPAGATATVQTLTQGDDGFGPAAEVPCAESQAQIGEGEAPVAVHAQAGGLSALVTYRWRVYAATIGSGSGGPARSEGASFTVPNPPNPVITGAAGNLTATGARLNGTVNPEGLPVAQCAFEYGESAAYGQTVPCVESGAEIGTGSAPVPVHADLSALSGNTTYHFRLTASNGLGQDAQFHTVGPLVEAQWATDVTTTEAVLHAQINPGGKEATYHLEYGRAGVPFEHVLPESASIGKDGVGHHLSVSLQGLEPGSAYRYRFVATNPDWTTVGAERAFSTYRPPSPDAGCPNQEFRDGAGAKLPDCRAYEAVSPLDKKGDVGNSFSDFVTPVEEASPDGDRATFTAMSALIAGQQSAPSVFQYLSRRDPASGWSTRSLDPPANSLLVINPALGIPARFDAFGSDLCLAYYFQFDDLALAPGAVPDYPDLYAADACGQGGYRVLTSAAPTNLSDIISEPSATYQPTIQAFTPDGGISVFRVNGALTPDANQTPQSGSVPAPVQLYVADDEGGLRLASVLPDGSAAPYSSSVGAPGGVSIYASNRAESVQHALSAEGSKLYWTKGGVALGTRGTLYLRVNPARAQSAIEAGHCSKPALACTLPVSDGLPRGAEARFQTASPDGSRAIFTLGPFDSDAGATLYEYDATAALAGEPQATRPIAGRVLGVLGASEDARRVYFLSNEDLGAGPNPAGESAAGGERNLYLYEAGEAPGFAFLGRLDEEDSVSIARLSPVAEVPASRTARVSADGLRLAFSSAASLTGYDNLDAASGERDAEVYLYEAAADGGEARLLCASCTPSGGRPTGRRVRAEEIPSVAIPAAALIPGWNNQQRPTRALSEDGRRLFFESYTPLLPTDTNGAADVYQWEAPGAGGCDTEDADYFALNEGCLSLISSGKSPLDSQFIDASTDGSDVFFYTNSSLLAADLGLRDLYDARIDGGFPPPSTPSAACEGEACQSPPEAPDDPTPASESFQGAGNVHEEAPVTRKPCAKGKVRRHGKCVARKHPAKKHRRAKRNRRAGR